MRLPTLVRNRTARFTLVTVGTLLLGACSANVTGPAAASSVKASAPSSAAALSGYVVAEGVRPVKPLTVAKDVPADSTK